MAYDYAKAFALLDNPFNPLARLPGLGKKKWQNDLASNPLMINIEPALERLYIPDAGPFGTYLKNFQAFARQSGYRDNPPQVGNSSFIFSIYGNEGTGKTTLSQVLISWLRQCKPEDGDWNVFDDWCLPKVLDPAKQGQRINELQERISKNVTPESYCCIVADDLVSGVLPKVLELYDQLVSDWTVFLFLLSNDNQLFPALSSSGKRVTAAFRMRPLSSDGALNFIKCRLGEFRVAFGNPGAEPPWLKTYPLFPFFEQDIRSAFDSNAVLGLVDGDTVSLRQFGGILNGILTQRLYELDDEFDITTVAEDKIKEHLLSLSSGYNRLVESKRLVVNG